MKLVFLIYPGVTALDAVGPYEVFNQLKLFDIYFVWKEAGPVVTDSGCLVLGATHSMKEIREADVLFVPGSSSDTLTMMADEEVLEWIRNIHSSTKFTASVCSGALILAAAGLLSGKSATTHWAGMDGLVRFGVRPEQEKRIVQSGKIITGAGVSAGIDLAMHLVSTLLGPEQAKLAQLLIEYDPQPPFDSGCMSKAGEAIACEAKKVMKKAVMSNPRNLVSLSKLMMRRWQSVLRKHRN
jgi:transcriptional regulator GlxA family with amidase domain